MTKPHNSVSGLTLGSLFSGPGGFELVGLLSGIVVFVKYSEEEE